MAARRNRMTRVIAMLAVLLACACSPNPITPSGAQSAGGPQFRVDPSLPQPLPEENGVPLVMGQVSGMALDERNGHVRIGDRPATLLPHGIDKSGNPVNHHFRQSP